MSLPLTEKYRPKCLDDVLGNEEIVKCLLSFDLNNLPNMLFYGPPGTGKTTSIRALLVNHTQMNILELNASDERGINVVREQIKQFASTYSDKLKVVILDEADSMSKDAQGALRRIMEDFRNTRFCLICNFAKKIIDPILSRCTKFRFSPVNNINRIKEVCLKEGISFDEHSIEILNNRSDGDMRKIMNDIQGIKASHGIISKSTIEEFLAITDHKTVKDIYNCLISEPLDKCLTKIAISEIECGALICELTDFVAKSSLKNKMSILKLMASIECRLAQGCSESIQMKALVGIFQIHAPQMIG